MGFIQRWLGIETAPAPPTDYVAGMSLTQTAKFIKEFLNEASPDMSEAFTQADIELALDDRGWLVGGKRMAGELDPLSRQVQVNRSRYYWLRDPLVKQAVRLYTDYAFGAEAMSYKTENPADQAKLDRFMKDRRNRRMTSKSGQRRLSSRLLVDGELFFGFFSDGTVRVFDCLQMTDIVTDPDDEDLVVAYKRVTSGKSGTSPKTLYYRPWDYSGPAPQKAAGEIQPYYGSDAATYGPITYEKDVLMYHLPFDSFEKRGNTLVGACSDWTREHRRFMVARVAITEALSQFAWKTTAKGGQKIINSIRAKLESTFSQTGLSGGTEHQPPAAPGANWIQNDGLNLEAMPRQTGASDAKVDSDNLKLEVCAGTGIMLHYFGDPSTGNLATATAMELPMLKMFEAYQQLWKDAWRDMFSIVLEEDPDEEAADIVITLPDIIDQDLQPQAMFMSNLFQNFPEAKIPSIMRRYLSILGVENLEEVMEEIADNKQQMSDQSAALVKAGTHVMGPNGKAIPKQLPDGSTDGGAAGTNTDNTEAWKKLVELLQ